jgi:hypothetical protein
VRLAGHVEYIVEKGDTYEEFLRKPDGKYRLEDLGTGVIIIIVLQEVLGRINVYFPLILDGPQRRGSVQHFSCC